MTWGMPYMGSKADIVQSIALNFPKADHFYDLFGGGGSMTHYMSLRKANNYKHFHYNEIKKHIADVFRKAVDGEFSAEIFKPSWISRDNFKRMKLTNGYVYLCWSFGNNGETYLFGQDIEEYKRSLHMAVVFNEFNDLAKNMLGITDWPRGCVTIKQKRLLVRAIVKFKNQDKSHVVLQRLEQLERLQQLQQLQRLEQLAKINRLEITNASYEHVCIEKNAVVYCDIPYAGTADYGNEFDHKKFFDWAATRPFPVFISEYKIEDPRFKLVYSVGKSVKLSPKGQTKEREDHSREKLHWNQVVL